MIRRLLLLILLAPLPAATLDAQTPAAAPDRGALKAQVEAREKRADLILDEIRAADSRIEGRVDVLLDALRAVGDSKDSRTKVARMKEQTIEALQKNLAYFEQRRAVLQEELRRPTLHLTEEEKRRAITKFDERIEKRVRQILDLNKSLPTHKDYEQYNVVGGGWYGATYVENEDYKHNRRLTSHTNTQRSKILKDLEASLDRLDRQNRDLQSRIQASTTEPQRAALAAEIARNDSLAKTRRAQLAETLRLEETPTRPISGREAQDLDAALRKSIDSLRRDFTTLFQRFSAYLAERSHANAARAALEAAGKR